MLKTTRRTLAIAVIVLALVVLAGRFGIAHLTQQTQYFEQVATQTLGYPVQIQHISNHWRGFHPQIVLQDVTVEDQSQHPLIKIKQLNLGINFLSSLWHLQFIPGTLEVSGASVSIFKDELGHWRLSGLEQKGAGEAAEFNDTLEWLSSQKRILLSDLQIQWQKTSTEMIPIHIEKIESYSENFETHVEGDITVKQPQVGSVHVAALINYPHVFDSLQAKIYIEANNINLVPWLEGVQLGDWQVKKGLVNSHIWATWKEKRWHKFQITVSSKDLVINKGEQTFNLSFKPIQFKWRQLSDDVWQCHGLLAGFTFNKTTISVPIDFLYRHEKDGHQLQVTEVSFATLNELVKNIPDLPADKIEQVNKLKLSGNLQNLYLQMKETGWLVDSYFSNIKSAADGIIPGVENLTGHIQATPLQGAVKIDSENIILAFPKVFRKKILFDQAQATAYWQMLPEGLLLQIVDGEVLNADGVVYGTVKLFFEKGNTSPWMSLVGGGRLRTSNTALAYLPFTIMPKEVVDWIDQALVKGKGKTEATVVINGPMSAFPFDHQEGKFIVDANLENVDLNFYPGWPKLHNLSGNLVFNNRSMSLQGGEGKVFNATTLQNLQAQIPYMGPAALAVISISGEAKTTVPDALAFIQHSPLNAILNYQFANLEGAGPIDLPLQLSIPLSSSTTPVQVKGNIVFGGENKIGANDVFIEKLQGQLKFDQYGISSPKLTGQLFNQPLTATITRNTQPDSIQSHGEINGMLSTAPLEKMAPGNPILKRISGTSNFSATFDMYRALGAKKVQSDVFELHSDLQGITIDLPEPLKKLAPTKQPAWLRVQTGNEGAIFTINDGKQTQAVIALQGKDQEFDRGVIAFNNPEVTLPNEEGLLLSGRLATLDVEAWRAILSPADDKNKKLSFIKFPDFLRKVDLTINKLNYLNRQWIDTNFQVSQENNTVAVGIRNNFFGGKINFNEKLNSLLARFDYVNLEDTDNVKMEMTPGTLPRIDFSSASVKIGKKNLGQVEFVTSPTYQGVIINRLTISSRAYRLNAEGEWRKTGRVENTHLQGNLVSADLATMLKDWGITPGATSNQVRSDFSLSWQGSPFDINTKTLNGNVSLDVKNGNITEIGESANLKIGLGRILNLLSLQNLQRTLQFHFSELTNKGFDFKSLEGKFLLNQGQASTQNITIDGSVAKVIISGRIGLATHDYDLSLAITPLVTTSLPVIATLAGGPVVGAVAWATDKLLSPAVQRLTTYHYQLTGAWEQPTIVPKSS